MDGPQRPDAIEVGCMQRTFSSVLWGCPYIYGVQVWGEVPSWLSYVGTGKQWAVGQGRRGEGITG